MDGLTQLKLLRERYDSPTELRIIRKNGPPLAGLYDDFELLIRDALAQNDHGACYVTLNPVHSSREVTNKLGIARSGLQVGNGDIVRRKALLIDIDPIRQGPETDADDPNKPKSSTDAERQSALDRANQVLAFTTEQGWPEPLMFSSGNGAALIFGIDLPKDDGRLAQHTLESLAHRFDDDKAKIDTKVHDPARITRLVGTMNRKGESTPERPHRPAEIIQAPHTLDTVPRELLEQLVEPAPYQVPTEVLTDFRVDEWLRGLNIRFTAKKGKCGDWDGLWYTIPYCPNKPNQDTDGNTGIFQSEDGLTIHAKCHHAKCADLTWQKLRAQLDPTFDARVEQVSVSGTDEGVCDPHRLAKIVLEEYAHPEYRKMILVQGDIYTWSDCIWTLRDKDEIKRVIARSMKKEFDRYAAARRRSGAPVKTPTVTNKLAGDVFLALTSLIEVDAKVGEWLQGEGPSAYNRIICKNGILNLKAFFQNKECLLPHTPRLFVTSLRKIDFDPDAPVPKRWLTFLEEVWPDDQQSQDLLQEFMGYCLNDSAEMQKFLMLIGQAGGGKGTITRVISGLVGSENTCSILLRNLGERFSLEEAMTKPVVFLPDATTPLLEKQPGVLEMLKSVVGGDSVPVDRKYRKVVSMTLPIKFIVSSNELLELRENSSALERRMLVLRFSKTFKDKADTKLDQKLQAELSGILLWALAGLKRLRESGSFTEPESSQTLKKELRKKGSPLAEFLDENCILGPDEWVPKKHLYAAWKDWCTEGDISPGKDAQFGRDLFAVVPDLTTKRKRFGNERPNAYCGITLRNDEAETANEMVVPMNQDSPEPKTTIAL